MIELICIFGTEYFMRVELANYLARHGWDEDEGPVGILLPQAICDHQDIQQWHAANGSVDLIPTVWDEEVGWSTDKDLGNYEVLILITDRAMPVAEQMERLRDWTYEFHCKLGRIFTVVDCVTLRQYPQLQEWYDSCIHFSDGVLLGNRAAVGNKWVKDFETQFNKRRIPCLLGYLKAGGKIDSVEEWLFPEPRRLSQYFDEVEESDFDDVLEGLEIEDGDAEEWMNDLTDEDSAAGNPDADLYLARNEMGFRKLTVHDFSILLQQLPL